MYEGSTRIPLFFAGPNIPKKIVKNFTSNIDILPTLIDIGGGKIPSSITGYSLLPFMQENKSNDHPDYVLSQFHSMDGNTGSFMVRKDQWKYVTFGHYLNAYKNYSAQLFNLDKDPQETEDVANENMDVVKELDEILRNEIDYEYVDCFAKKTDFLLFETYFWNIYGSNKTAMMEIMQQCYDDFDNNDYTILLNWRNEMLSAPDCSPTNINL